MKNALRCPPDGTSMAVGGTDERPDDNSWRAAIQAQHSEVAHCRILRFGSPGEDQQEGLGQAILHGNAVELLERQMHCVCGDSFDEYMLT